MNVLSLFSGCLGLDLGLEAAGFTSVAYVENDPDCQRIIAARRPGVPIIGDVHELDSLKLFAGVDVLAGGFPCQDLSYAGRGAGLDGERSGLWFRMADAIRVVRPRYVIVENVPGLATRGLGRVLYDLAEAGYVGSWIRVRAADIGAPHGRDRLFILAALTERVRVDADGGVHGRGEGEPGGSAQAAVPAGAEVAFAADAVADCAGPAADAERDAERRPRPGEVPRAPRAGEGEGPERQRVRADARDGDAAAADTGSVAGAPAGERDSGPGARSESRARGNAREAESGVAGRAGSGGEAAADAGGDGLVRVAPVDGEDGGLGVASGDDVDGRGVGGAGPDGGHAREAAADSDDGADVGQRARQESRRGGEGSASAADADGEPGESRQRRRAPGGDRARRGAPERDGSGHDGPAEQGAPVEAASDPGGVGRSRQHGRRLEGRRREPEGTGPAAADADDAGREEHGGTVSVREELGSSERGGSEGIEWGVYGPAVERWADIIGRPAPRPTDDRGRLEPRFVEWMLGFPDGWVEVDGMKRTAQLRMLGNSVQVQVGELVGRLLVESM